MAREGGEASSVTCALGEGTPGFSECCLLSDRPTPCPVGRREASIPSTENMNFYVFLKGKVALVAAWLYR